MASEKTKIKKRRQRERPNNRWSSEDTLLLLHKITEDVTKFEKPTAQIFYKKLIRECKKLQKFDWESIRYKMKNLKYQYIKANDCRHRTETDLLEGNDGKTVRDCILKLCPQWDLLDEIFREKTNVNDFENDQEFFVSKYGVDIGADVSSQHDTESSPHFISKNNNNPITSQINDELTNFEGLFSDRHNKNVSTQPKRRTKIMDDSLAYLSRIQQQKLKFHKEKFEAEMKLQREKFELERELQKEKLLIEREALNHEREKSIHEINLKEAQIHSEEKIKILQLEQEERLRRYELELKYQKTTDYI